MWHWAIFTRGPGETGLEAPPHRAERRPYGVGVHKDILKPWQKQELQRAPSVAHMEDVCWTCTPEPYDPQRPVVCFDETSTQYSRLSRDAPSATTSTAERALEFLACEPLAGWRSHRDPAAHDAGRWIRPQVALPGCRGPADKRPLTQHCLAEIEFRKTAPRRAGAKPRRWCVATPPELVSTGGSPKTIQSIPKLTDY